MKPLLLILCVVGLVGCSSNKDIEAIKTFCKGCNGKMTAELKVAGIFPHFILRCDDFTKDLQ